MSYSVPDEAAKLLREGILQNTLLRHNLPPDAALLADHVHYDGNALPSIPVNWRFAEGIAALKGLEATWMNALLQKRYGLDPAEIHINTDHASLFIMSTFFVDLVNERGEPVDAAPSPMHRIGPLFRLPAKDEAQSSLWRASVTSIYKTKDGKYYHIHGSLDARPTLAALGLPNDQDVPNRDAATRAIQDRIVQFNAAELDSLINDEARQPGTVALGVAEYQQSEQGRANREAGLWEISLLPNAKQKPGWWAAVSGTTPQRPLAGIKVLDLARVIAGPTISRELAELGASVMKVTASSHADFSTLHADLNWGKWSTFIDLKTDEGKQALQHLIAEADVLIDGFRPGALDRLGFGREAVLELVKDRPFGIVYARENTYGWHGPWKDRCGWQQISDACCGVSLEYGRAMGRDEAVTPILPNSDYSTGVIGACGVIDALIRRHDRGGSVFIDTALNYYSQWLAASCGTYPAPVWQDLWARHDKLTFRHWNNMPHMFPLLLQSLQKNSRGTLLNPDFFEVRYSKAMEKHFKCLRPVLQFPGEQVQPGYQVGTRPNGWDAPRWPKDLATEVAT
ncbi:hypothetical protein BDV12DRAFT_207856 [Aspergillus spectabilis]